MGFHQLPHQRQANAQAFALMTGMLVVRLAEEIEHLVQIVLLEPHAAVDDVQLRHVLDTMGDQLDAAIPGRELQRVVQRVPDDLLQACAVGIDHQGRLGRLGQLRRDLARMLVIDHHGVDILENASQVHRLFSA